MRYIFILLILAQSSFCQNEIIEYQILAINEYQKVFCTYSFDARGYPIQIIKTDSDNKVFSEIKIEYDGGLVKRIKLYRPRDPQREKELDFFYDQSKNLVTQKWSDNEDSINFIYDNQNRLVKKENYNDSDVFIKYDSLNRIKEEYNKSTHEETLDYFDVITYEYLKDKTIKIQTYNSPYGSKTFTTTYEYKDDKLVKEISTNTQNDWMTIVTEYEYAPTGILISENAMDGITKFKVILKNQDLKKDIVEEINKILISDFSSIKW